MINSRPNFVFFDGNRRFPEKVETGTKEMKMKIFKIETKIQKICCPKKVGGGKAECQQHPLR